MRKKILQLGSFLFFTFLATSIMSQEKSDTTKIKMGNKKIIIIEDKEDFAKKKEALEKGKSEFEDNIELLEDSILSLEKQIEDETIEKEKRVAIEKEIQELKKQKKAIEKGIRDIEFDIEAIEDELETEIKKDEEIEEWEDDEGEGIEKWKDFDNEDFDILDLFPKKKKKNKFNGHYAGFELGLSGILSEDNTFSLNEEDEFLELNQTRSWYFALNFLEYNIPIVHDNFGLVTGLNIDWRNYHFENEMTLKKVDGKVVGVENSDRNFSKNKLTITHMNVPLLLELQTTGKKYSKRLYLSIGVYGGVNIRSRLKQNYEVDGEEHDVKIKADYQLNPFNYGATVRVGISALKLFANYDMSSLFEKDKGPEVYPFNVGITLVNF